MKKNLLLAAASMGFALFMLEIALYFLMPRYTAYRYDFDFDAKLDEIVGVFSSESFDEKLGWDRQPVMRNLGKDKNYFAQSYGDSFVYCSEVPEEDSWQAYFRSLTGKAIANFGVGGYGIDQAVLKFEEFHKSLDTEVAILGIYRQMHLRNLSHQYVYLTHAEHNRFAFKPIFSRQSDGYDVSYPPCNNAECLLDLLKNRKDELEPFLERHDYFFVKNKSLAANRFPRTLMLPKMWPELAYQKYGSVQEKHFFPTDEAVDLSSHLVRRFVDKCRKENIQPLILLIYSVRDLETIRYGNKPDEIFVDGLRKEQIPFLDTSEFILENWPHDRLRELKAEGPHFAAQGNHLVAQALATYFENR